MNALTKKAHATKDFVVKHKVAIAVTLTSVFWVKVNKNNIEQYNDFLKEHDLYEQFWNAEV